MSLDAIGIVSKNLEKTVHFYSLLGIDLQEVGGPGHMEGVTTGGVRFMADSLELVKQIDSNWTEPKGSAGVAFCFKQESPKRVDELYSQITKAGYKGVRAPWDAFWGQRYSTVQDPDGNHIDLFAAL